MNDNISCLVYYEMSRKFDATNIFTADIHLLSSTCISYFLINFLSFCFSNYEGMSLVKMVVALPLLKISGH